MIAEIRAAYKTHCGLRGRSTGVLLCCVTTDHIDRTPEDSAFCWSLARSTDASSASMGLRRSRLNDFQGSCEVLADVLRRPRVEHTTAAPTRSWSISAAGPQKRRRSVICKFGCCKPQTVSAAWCLVSGRESPLALTHPQQRRRSAAGHQLHGVEYYAISAAAARAVGGGVRSRRLNEAPPLPQSFSVLTAVPHSAASAVRRS